MGNVTALREINEVRTIDDRTLPLAPAGGFVTSRVEVDDTLIGWVGDERVATRGGRRARRWWVAHRLTTDTCIRWRLDGFTTRRAAVAELTARVYGLDDAGLAGLGMSRK